MNNISDKIKQIDIVNYMEHNYNISSRRLNNNQYRGSKCPICGHHDCFTMYSNTNSWNCFSCNKGGDIASLLIETGKVNDFKGALNHLGLSNEIKSNYEAKPHKIEFRKAPERIDTDKKKATVNYKTPLDQSTEDTLEALEKAINSNSKDHTADAVINSETAENVLKTDYTNYFHDRGLNDAIIAKYDLRVDGDYAILPCGIRRNIKEKKYYNPQGQSVSFLNCDYLNTQGIYFVCEGIFDALSIESLGYKAISINSVSNVSKFVDKLCTDSLLICAFDNDEAGIKAYNELLKYCNSHNINLEKLNIHPYKDVNEFLISNKEELSKRIKSIASIPDARSNSFDILANKEKINYLSTGINTLDSALGGGIIADLYCLGGVPGAGKSAFMLQVASSLSAKGQHVLYVSLELSASEIDARNASRLSFSRDKENYLTALEINSGNVIEAKKGIFQAIKEEYQTTFQNFWITTSCQTTKDIALQANKHKMITGVSPVIMVDYIQQIKGDDAKTEKQVIDEAVLDLKQLSNELKTSVFFIASLNRAGYKVGDMASFKESGGIEYSAAVAMTLKPTKAGLETIEAKKTGDAEVLKKPVEVELDIMKNRHYIPNSIKMDFFGSGNTFTEKSIF